VLHLLLSKTAPNTLAQGRPARLACQVRHRHERRLLGARAFRLVGTMSPMRAQGINQGSISDNTSPAAGANIGDDPRRTAASRRERRMDPADAISVTSVFLRSAELSYKFSRERHAMSRGRHCHRLPLDALSRPSRNQTGDFEHAPPSAVRGYFWTICRSTSARIFPQRGCKLNEPNGFEPLRRVHDRIIRASSPINFAHKRQ